MEVSLLHVCDLWIKPLGCITSFSYNIWALTGSRMKTPSHSSFSERIKANKKWILSGWRELPSWLTFWNVPALPTRPAALWTLNNMTPNTTETTCVCRNDGNSFCGSFSQLWSLLLLQSRKGINLLNFSHCNSDQTISIYQTWLINERIAQHSCLTLDQNAQTGNKSLGTSIYGRQIMGHLGYFWAQYQGRIKRLFNLVRSKSSSSYTLSSHKRSLELHGQRGLFGWMYHIQEFPLYCFMLELNRVLIPTSTRSLFFVVFETVISRQQVKQEHFPFSTEFLSLFMFSFLNTWRIA